MKKIIVLIAAAVAVAVAAIVATYEKEPEAPLPAEATEAPMGSDIVDSITDVMRISKIDYAHTNPGVSSEIYVNVESFQGTGTDVEAKLYLDNELINTKTSVVDDNGTAYFVFTIYQFGSYTVVSNDGTLTASSGVTVE